LINTTHILGVSTWHIRTYVSEFRALNLSVGDTHPKLKSQCMQYSVPLKYVSLFEFHVITDGQDYFLGGARWISNL
jgi:hypothetical protein